ncbi:flavin containing amine oxidoreductase [Colletotrichum karsti]|uniref:Amine oxidase n=1 Tax=Colletotrichum karsti TaxID=1095194 RepID=A0A9P6I0U8_9PEZI|nr:flavin containing amine oxidoreductase [Colletotrichum karsti]KAF9873999.1 flavin containing amine oxidoreductase [Colletotrichum karsti]
MFDVVVIGAGMAGLQAAYSAKQAGLSIVVLEARDRVGGKVWSIPLASGKGVADLGAAWINDKLQPRVTAYVRQFGLDTTVQAIDGVAIMQVSEDQRLEFPFGIVPDFPEEEKQNLIRIRDHIETVATRKEAPRSEDDEISLDTYVRNLGANDKTAKMVNIWARAMHGLESTQESAAYFIDYCRSNHGLLAIRADDQTGGNYMRLQGGTMQIARGMAGLVGEENIFLSEPVASIHDHNTQVAVTTTTGKIFRARKCIISVPSALLKDLKFTPSLPAPVQQIANSSRLGNYNKAILFYDKPWWEDLGYNGFFFSYVGPISIARNSSVPEKGHYALTCFINGDPGEAWSKLPAHERRHAVLNQLASVYKAGKDSDLWRPLEIFEQIWKHEQYSQGALAPIPALGHYTKFASVYGKSVGNLHFVGTEYANHWKGYMEGALTSGAEGAREVVDAIRHNPKAHL